MSHSTRALPTTRPARLAAGLLLGLIVLAAAPVLADEAPVRTYGFTPSPDFEREYAERLRVYPEDKQTLPTSFSWVPYMTPAKDQGSCGSCWSFAAMGQIEAHMKINYGKTLDLSEQQGINCNPYGADCGGGWASAVYNIAQTHGIIREEAMPYIEGEGLDCQQWDKLPYAHMVNWWYVGSSVTQIKTALLDGPVCTSMQADGILDDYVTGCLTAPSTGWTDHLVLIVGWDDRACDNNGAWIVKNSWGADFGDGGLFTCEYGSASMGQNVTQIQLTVPDVQLGLTGPDPEQEYLAGDEVTVTWTTGGAGCATVDVWYGAEGYADVLVADGVANTGSVTFTLPNATTDRARFFVVANGDTRDGFDISDRYTVIGHKTVYVSAAGGNVFPYDSPATAAHDINDALTACAGHDSVLVAGGDYTGTVGVSGTTWVIGGWDPTFTTKDARANPTRVTSSTSGMVFVEATTGHTGVEGFEFHDCQGTVSSTPASGMHGAGIYIHSSSPVVRDCVFTNNTAQPFGGYGVGGGIAVIGGSPRIETCTFTGNTADLGGAIALFNAPGAVVEGCVFTSNGCKSDEAGQDGGVVYAQGGTLDFVGNTATSNVLANRGGVIFADGCALTLADNDLAGNRALVSGGAIAVVGGSVAVAGGRFDANLADASSGAALWVVGGDADLRNAVFTGNVSGQMAAAVMFESTGTTGVENCAFSGNATTGNSLGAVGVISGATLVFRNNVLADNPSGGVGGGVGSATVDYNVFWNNSVDHLGLTPGAHDLQGDPQFLDPAGGDWSLALHSAALDRGDPDGACADPDGSRNDAGPCGGPAADFVAPPAVAGAALTNLGDGTYELTWAASGDPDVVSYVIYRDGSDPFVPDAGKVAATLAHPAASWTDPAPSGDPYWVVAVDAAGRAGGYSAKLEPSTAADDLPRALAVTGVTPNPFNPRTTVAFAVPRDARVIVRVHDMRGRVVRTLVDGPLTAGRHETVWDGRDDGGATAATGVYLVRVHDGREATAAKVMLTK